MDFSKVLSFLEALSESNNRDWFNENKSQFSAIKNEFDAYINKIILVIRNIDSSIGNITAKDCVFRIYRDVRFSLNKDPYKTHLGAYISNGGRKSRLAGYYIHIQPGQSFMAAGAYQPLGDVLKEIRYEILDNTDEFKKIIEDSNFKKFYSTINGEKTKLAPKGFPKDFVDIELLKYKSYEIIHMFPDSTILSDKFEKHIIEAVKAALPLNSFLNKAILNVLESSEE
jgi:uncharacterized protein (TIGR02453 family)